MIEFYIGAKFKGFCENIARIIIKGLVVGFSGERRRHCESNTDVCDLVHLPHHLHGHINIHSALELKVQRAVCKNVIEVLIQFLLENIEDKKLVPDMREFFSGYFDHA